MPTPELINEILFISVCKPVFNPVAVLENSLSLMVKVPVLSIDS